MTDIFKDILPSILQTKKNVIEDEKDYVPFIVNRALSYHYDCILYANEMNKWNNISPTMQYEFYLNKVRPYKRPFQKWVKRETVEDLEAIKEYYSYSNEKAKEALKVLSEDQLKEIKTRTNKGGMNNARPKRSNLGEITRT